MTFKKMNEVLAHRFKEIPQKPGVYLFKDAAGRIIYIGKATNLKSRVRHHFGTLRLAAPGVVARSGNNASPFVDKIADIDWIRTKNESQAMILENQLIKKYQPRYNIQWRDDKSYFWVRLTDDEWPRVLISHKSQVTSHKASIVGPFVSGRELRTTLRALRKILSFRTCKNSYKKPCLQWHLGLCVAHKPNSKIKNQNVKLQLKIQNYKNLLNTISQFLRLYAGEKIRIEAYDISNIQGKHATGSMIVFYGNKPSKSDYRRFRIKTIHGANDAAMIKEVLRRRFNHPEWPIPELMLIDGGLAQLRAAASVTKVFERSSEYFSNSQEPIPVIALAKREEEIYTEYSAKPLKLSQLPESLRLTFQAIRDEAHRFAIFYYRYLHEKRGFGKSHAEIRKRRFPQGKA